MRVGLLGPLLVVGGDGAEVRVGAPKERAVLSWLALRAGASVRSAEVGEGVVGGCGAGDGGRDVARTMWPPYVGFCRREQWRRCRAAIGWRSGRMTPMWAVSATGPR